MSRCARAAQERPPGNCGCQATVRQQAPVGLQGVGLHVHKASRARTLRQSNVSAVAWGGSPGQLGGPAAVSAGAAPAGAGAEGRPAAALVDGCGSACGVPSGAVGPRQPPGGGAAASPMVAVASWASAPEAGAAPAAGTDLPPAAPPARRGARVVYDRYLM